RLEMVLVAEVAERRLARFDSDVDRAAATAVAAVRPAARNVRFLAERGRAVAARAGLDEDLDAVEEHRGHCRPVRSSRVAGPPPNRRREGTFRRSEVQQRVDARSAVPDRPAPDLEVQVRTGRVPGHPAPPNLLPT